MKYSISKVLVLLCLFLGATGLYQKERSIENQTDQKSLKDSQVKSVLDY